MSGVSGVNAITLDSEGGCIRSSPRYVVLGNNDNDDDNDIEDDNDNDNEDEDEDEYDNENDNDNEPQGPK